MDMSWTNVRSTFTKDVSPVDETVLPARTDDGVASPDERPSGVAADIVLVPADCPIPVRCPERFGAFLLTEVDIVSGPDLDCDGDVLHMTGVWLTTLPTADRHHDGDLVVLLHEPTASPARCDPDCHADVEMRLVNGKRWQRVGIWPGVDGSWPHLIAPTAAAIMSLHTDILELEQPPQRIRFASGRPDTEFAGAELRTR
ncbi:hypothetical protein M8542_36295 [Amycolatopsis sp. OK19-0408]|uniref:Uncharacterized protein n=1 Tax=Amycolatopsis iheyensis TaxID=2945988 RepID=A0A9X2SPL8_9PSEU|nr:hypothetical protein [Amycolatopsis iheyensis]MCR6488306.1 hypothetical protein [Amycolatopsis iheyensis]